MGEPHFSKQDGSLIPPYTHEKDGSPVVPTEADKKWDDRHMTDPYVCLVPDEDKPMTFKGEPFCSDKCAKLQGKGPKEGYRGRNAG